MNEALIDEHQLVVCPVVLGDGRPLFQDKVDKFELQLLEIASYIWTGERSIRRLCARAGHLTGPVRPPDNLDGHLQTTREMNRMRMTTYVNFAGNCADAFRFYEQHLGGTIGMMMTHGQAPDQSQVKPEWKDAVLHARLSIGGTELMGADIPNAEPMRSAYLSIGADNDAEAERMFEALSQGGKVFMPMQETFFATRFGQLRDRFGINWMILRERPVAGRP